MDDPSRLEWDMISGIPSSRIAKRLYALYVEQVEQKGKEKAQEWINNAWSYVSLHHEYSSTDSMINDEERRREVEGELDALIRQYHSSVLHTPTITSQPISPPTGSTGVAGDRAQDVPIAEPKNIFRKHAGVYEIRFNAGPTSYAPRTSGLDCILVLLRSPRIGIPATDFPLENEGTVVLKQARSEGMELVSPYIQGTELDAKAKEEIKSKLKRLLDVELPQLREKLTEFEESGNIVEQQECEEEIAIKEREMDELDAALRERTRPEKDRNSVRLSNAIRNAITRALNNLEKDPATHDFYLHFKKSFSGGLQFVYDPPEEVDWVTQ